MKSTQNILITLFARYSILSNSPLVLSHYSTLRFHSKWTQPVGHDTGIKIYNPITKTKEPFIIENKHFVKWYACGPTVYDSPHIGHAVCNVKLDIIRRILENYFHLNTIVISSVTDIDDKIINRANSLNQDCKTIAKKYELEYFEAMEQFGILPPTRATRVSEFMDTILSFIQSLVDTKQAYIGKDGSVYFDVDKYPYYYKLWGESNSTDHSIKKSSLDFSLWKHNKPNEPYFESQFGKGRPGWHIECSAMASYFFNSKIDLHTGGIDLKFPHHENEEAQSCAYHNNSQWVNYWLHTGHLRGKDGTKMSKSLGNFVTVKDYLSKHTPNQLRMMCLLSPYGSDMDYNEQTLEGAKHVNDKINTFIETSNDYMHEKIKHGNVDSSEMMKILEQSKETVHNSICDDFSTSKVLDNLIHIISVANLQLHKTKQEESNVLTLITLNSLSHYISNTLNLFGLNLSPIAKTSNQSNLLETRVNAVLDSAVNFRTQVRKLAIALKPDSIPVLKQCDEFRDELKALGIHVKDQKTDATWQFKGSD